MCSGQIRLCGPGTALTDAVKKMEVFFLKKEVCATLLLLSKNKLKLLHLI